MAEVISVISVMFILAIWFTKRTPHLKRGQPPLENESDAARHGAVGIYPSDGAGFAAGGSLPVCFQTILEGSPK
jgi:hypothetical protein